MPKRVSKDNVYDENGKRRFHGAFTGGFSAGYYNSVGTEEGWKPTAFISSRDQRVEFKQYSKEDFMDDEDDRLAGRNLETVNIYSDKGRTAGRNQDGQRVTRVQKKANTVSEIIRSKRHYYGIGYVAIQGLHSSAMLLEDDRNKVLRMGDVFKQPSVNASGFGISALEDEDDNVYAVNDPSQFDREIDFSHNRIRDIEKEEDEHHRHHHNAKPADIDGFVFARKRQAGSFEMEVFPPPRLPHNFRERHVFARPLEWSWVISKGGGRWGVSFLERITSPARPVDRRFTRMTPGEVKEEASKPMSSSLASKFVPAGSQPKPSASGEVPSIQLKSVHTTEYWRPAKLLCKRFNIQDPYRNAPDVKPVEEPKPEMRLDELMPTKAPEKKENVEIDVGELAKEFSDPLQNIKKADVDLFDALFN